MLRFIDSLAFLSTSLEKLVDNLKLDGLTSFKHTERHFGADKLDLVSRKGVFPYEYIKSLDVLDELQLPPKAAFYSRLNEEGISDAEYDHAQRVWSTFDMKTLRDYQNLYVKTDVLLLADVFEAFRETSLRHYQLDPAHFYTTPGLSFQACLKRTQVRLELLTDESMLLMLENGIRGGTSYISCREAEANNPYVQQTYDPTASSSYIVYLDANNLYGWAMSQPLPVGGFKWMSPRELQDFSHKSEILSLLDDAETGYILEVDLTYPTHLHDVHNDYPLAVEHLKLTEDMLSPAARALNCGRKYVPTTKLVPNLNDKVRYTVHYRNLKYYLEQGMVLTRIHRGIKFRQSPWLAPYIELNTNLRRAAKSKFEKDFFKLLNNSMYGKTMESLRKRTTVHIVSEVKAAERHLSKHTCKRWQEINEDFTLVQMMNNNIRWTKPTFVGFSVLDLSKLHMYRFHYDVVRPKYGDHARLLFTDTDSLCYRVQTEDLYEDMLGLREHLDTSEYPPEHRLFSRQNEKVIGKFKDECSGVAPVHFVGLRSKMYSLLLPGDKAKATAKGVKTRYASKHLRHADYVRCLREGVRTSATYQCFRSRNHVVTTDTVTKVALSAFDDKRHLLPDTGETLAHGHRLLRV
jgi:hypothetical protein